MKKLLAVTLIVGLVVLIGAGAIVMTWSGVRALTHTSTEDVTEENWPAYQGNGPGWGRERERVSSGQGQNQCEEETHEWVTIEATVITGTDEGPEIVVETTQGDRVTVGIGPGWLAAQGFVLREGDKVVIQGFWEVGEFKAGEIVRQRDGARLALRDETGRPAWAGMGRRASSIGRQGWLDRDYDEPGFDAQRRDGREGSRNSTPGNGLEESYGYGRNGGGVQGSGRGRGVGH